MAVPIRTLIFAGIIAFVYLWAFIGFVGSYELNNSIAINATLKTQYMAVVGNSSDRGIFGTTGNLSQQAQQQSADLGGLSTLNTIGMAAQYIGAVPAVYQSAAILITQPFAGVLGVQMSTIEADMILLLVINIVLAILSAIFLFPI